MAVQCFERMDLNPPVCGLHNVSLVQDLVPIDPNAPWLGRVACSFCPVSRVVVDKKGGSHAPA